MSWDALDLAPAFITDAFVLGFLRLSSSSARSTPVGVFSAGALSMRFGLFSSLLIFSVLLRLAWTAVRCFSTAILKGAVEEVEDDEGAEASPAEEPPPLTASLIFCFLAGPKGTISSKGLFMGFVGVGMSTTRFPLVFLTANLVFFAAADAAAVVVFEVPEPAFEEERNDGSIGGVIVGTGASSAEVVKTSSSL